MLDVNASRSSLRHVGRLMAERRPHIRDVPPLPGAAADGAELLNCCRAAAYAVGAELLIG